MLGELFDGYYEGACHGSLVDFCGPTGRTPQTDAFCNVCPVKDECLAHGLANEALGVWGGKSEDELRQLRKIMRIPQPALRTADAFLLKERLYHDRDHEQRRLKAQRKRERLVAESLVSR